MAVDRTREWFLSNSSKTGLYIHYHKENAMHLLSQPMAESFSMQSYMSNARSQIRQSFQLPKDTIAMLDEVTGPGWEDELARELAEQWNNDVIPKVAGALSLSTDISQYRQAATRVKATSTGGVTAYGITEILAEVDKALGYLQLNLHEIALSYLQDNNISNRTTFNLGNGEFSKVIKGILASYENKMIDGTPAQKQVARNILEQMSTFQLSKKGSIKGQITQLFNTTVGEQAVAWASNFGGQVKKVMQTGQYFNVRGKDAKPDAIVQSCIALDNLCKNASFSETINVGLNIKWYGKNQMRKGKAVPFSQTAGYTLESTTLERALFPYVNKMVAANKLVHLGNAATDEAKLVIAKSHVPSAFMGSGAGIFNAASASRGALIPGVKDTSVLFVANGRAYSILDLLNRLYKSLMWVNSGADLTGKTGISINWKGKEKIQNRFEPIDGYQETPYTEAIKRSDLIYSSLLGTTIQIKFAPGVLFGSYFSHMT